MNFLESKKRIISTYNDVLAQGLVDKDMIPINDTINSHDAWVTTSSCSGRMILISKSQLRAKYETEFHFKTHNSENITKLDLSSIPFEGELWFLVEAPNLHVRCSDLEKAKLIHSIALQSKLSKSKFQSIDPSITVEILGTGSMQIPLGENGNHLVNSEHWKLIMEKSIDMLNEEQERLNSFHKKLINLN